MRGMLRDGIVVTSLLFVGCEAQLSPIDVPVVFVSRTDEGDPIANVKLSSRGHAMGATDATGKLRLSIRGMDGDAVPFDVECPVGFSRSGKNQPFILRNVTSLHGSSESEVVVRCQSDRRVAALLVNAPDFADLPVLVHGQEVARTDAHGVAHVSIPSTSNTPLRVVLDTKARPYVVPASPHKDIRVGTRDEIFVFQPELSEVLPAKPKVKRKAKDKEPEQPVEPLLVRPERL